MDCRSVSINNTDCRIGIDNNLQFAPLPETGLYSGGVGIQRTSFTFGFV